MNKEKLSKKYNSLVYNHLWLKFVIEYGYATIISAISALLFALAVGLFIKPTSVDIEMVSGGASGFSQVLSKSLELLHIKEPANLPSFYSIFYLLTNVPLIILAFKCIGKRFAIFTLVNVFLVFLFVNFINGGIFDAIGSYVNEKGGGLIARALFAGLFTGLSSALAYTIDSSAGGFDILSYYISQKKSTSIGKYTVAINFAIMVSFAVVSSIYKINIDGATNKLEVWAQGLSGIFYSSIYLITVMLVVDVISWTCPILIVVEVSVVLTTLIVCT